MELRHRLRLGRPDLGEGVLVVDEAVDDRGHRHAERRLAVVGLPGGLGDVGEIVHALEIVQAVELVLLIERERGVERTAGDEVAGRAAVEPGVERGVVFLRRGRRELDLDVGIGLVEGGNDLRVPDVGVVVAPALDLQRSRLRGDDARHERRDRDGRAGNCLPCPVHRFSPLFLGGRRGSSAALRPSSLRSVSSASARRPRERGRRLTASPQSRAPDDSSIAALHFAAGRRQRGLRLVSRRRRKST